jgi:hypothetical protein
MIFPKPTINTVLLAPLKGRTKETFNCTGCAVLNGTGIDSLEFECRNKNLEGRDRAQFEGTNPEFTWENPEKSPRLSIRKSDGPDNIQTRQNLHALTCAKLSTCEPRKVLPVKVTQCTDVTSCSRVFICDN